MKLYETLWTFVILTCKGHYSELSSSGQRLPTLWLSHLQGREDVLFNLLAQAL